MLFKLVFAHEKSAGEAVDWKRSRAKIVICLHIEYIIKLSSWRWDRLHATHSQTHISIWKLYLGRFFARENQNVSFLKWKLIAFHPFGIININEWYLHMRIFVVARARARERLLWGRESTQTEGTVNDEFPQNERYLIAKSLPVSTTPTIGSVGYGTDDGRVESKFRQCHLQRN